MKGIALLGILVVVGGLLAAVRFLLRPEHHNKDSGTEPFSPGDPAKSDLGPNPP
jgi:hypothetical protein